MKIAPSTLPEVPMIPVLLIDIVGFTSVYRDGNRKKAVGSFPRGRSPEGVWDLAGNVWEWCTDWYDRGYYRKSTLRDPEGPKSGYGCILRGGTWSRDASFCRCMYRGQDRQFIRWGAGGFRVVLRDF